ncbi:hypothetical protein [Escherichia coli]|uniref:hypothetical protein n=1 Tax=Escherichia coli TaxID=562 RepID=UPI0013E9159C|nr:hypothetical protein [Escherichia coli]
MSTKLWGGRFDMPTNKLVEQYNATITLEQRLCPFDIQGSIVLRDPLIISPKRNHV